MLRLACMYITILYYYCKGAPCTCSVSNACIFILVILELLVSAMFSELQWLFVLVIVVCLSLVQSAESSSMLPLVLLQWHIQDCQCYKTWTLPRYRTHHNFILECSQRRVLMNAEYCLTNEMDGTFVGHCKSYLVNKNLIIEDGIYIQLPDNTSQLNNYICGSMNRKGWICSECIDGFAPSVTSLGYECSNCSTSSWLGYHCTCV